jgi:hypothetical protein
MLSYRLKNINADDFLDNCKETFTLRMLQIEEMQT